jgi:hypothetical protein
METQNNDDQHPVYSGYGFIFPETGNVPDIDADKHQINYELQKRGPRNRPDSEQKPEIDGQADKDVSTFGESITVNLANKLVLEFFEEFNNRVASMFRNLLLSDRSTLTEEKINEEVSRTIMEFAKIQIYQTTFSREVLTMLLSQPNCAGVKFYYCMGLAKGEDNKSKPSLVLVGVDNKNRDLNSKGDIEKKSIIYLKQTNGEVYTDSVTGLTAPRQETLVYEVGGVDSKAIKTLDEEYVEMAKSGLNFLSQNSSNTTTGDE